MNAINLKNVCVVSGARSDYGHLKPLLKALQVDPDINLQFVVTGMHMSPEFGLTFTQIEADGIEITERFEMLLSGDTASSVAKSVGLAIHSFSDIFERIKPNVVVLLGDRFEMLAAAQVALFLAIPIAHIHGGEITEGAFDEQIRHAITKASTLHFTAAATYRKRVIQLGEAPNTVFNIGALGLEYINSMKFLDVLELEEQLGIKLNKRKNFLITYHPVTLNSEPNLIELEALLSSLEQFSEAQFIFTLPNADTGGKAIREKIEMFINKNKNKSIAFHSLGQIRYLSLMKLSTLVLGNSSSGLIEAPYLKVPSVNVGERQAGRLVADSVIQSRSTQQSITASIKLAMSSHFKEKVKTTIPHYQADDCAQKIISILKKPLPSVKKTFFDIDHDY